MAENRFTYLDASRNKYIGSFFCNGIPLTNQEVVDLLNELSTENRQLKQENEQLKSSFTEFAKMIEFDIDNGIEVYPKRLLEYIINISKEYGK